MSEDQPATGAPPARPALPKRFYKQAKAAPHEAGFVVELDGRLTRTPARNYLAVPQEALGAALAAEWEAQAETIDPATMPLTRLVNSAIDRVTAEMPAVRGCAANAGGRACIGPTDARVPRGSRSSRSWRAVTTSTARAALATRRPFRVDVRPAPVRVPARRGAGGRGEVLQDRAFGARIPVAVLDQRGQRALHRFEFAQLRVELGHMRRRERLHGLAGAFAITPQRRSSRWGTRDCAPAG